MFLFRGSLVGSVTAFSLAKYGAGIIGVSDAFGALHNSQGIDLWALEKHVAAHKTVTGFSGVEAITNGDLLLLPSFR